MRHDPQVIRLQIEQLLRQFPELQEDDIPLALESETDAVEYLRSIERVRQDAVALAKATDLVIDDLTQRKRRFERRDEAIRQLMLQMLQSANLRKIELPEATLSVRNGSAKVIVTDETALPETFIRIKREPDKARIKVALQDGTQIPGATLSNAEEYITVRTK
jgi:hypothetical protein